MCFRSWISVDFCIIGKSDILRQHTAKYFQHTHNILVLYIHTYTQHP
jgi:hypothetical protein